MNKTALFIGISTLYLMFFSPPLRASEESFDEWKKSFRTQAINAGLDDSYIDNILPRMQLLPQVVESDKKQPEFQLTFWDYIDRTLTEKRLKDGRRILKEHKNILETAEKKYNVPAKYIVSFWGMETNYGGYKGNIDTLNALTTLAYDKRRRTFFTRELITFLKVMKKDKLKDVKGSWAGAFGHFQFMPTTFDAYAVDGDGDGRRDIVNSIPDAVESAANYLSKIGWNNEVKWGREVKSFKPVSWKKLHEKEKRPLHEWIELGFEPANDIEWPKTSEFVQAEFVMPMGIHGPAFLGYDNYRVSMRWNKSQLYALAVGLLSDALVIGEYQIYKPRKNIKISYNQIQEIQELLTKRGYYTGQSDGVCGTGTRQAIKAYQKDENLPQDGYATIELLNKLKGL
ncbi:MAG: lytic murein transglycosylase [Alphaproteobacteria bacterium]|nr:lytic murein transglycosylase [Alphaproteobacteria bacterium]